MDIQTHARLLQLLETEFVGKQANMSFTQWDTDQDDEEETRFAGRLAELNLQDNEFGEKDLALVFQTEDDETVEILMEVPAGEEDLGSFDGSRLSIFGTEAELVLVK